MPLYLCLMFGTDQRALAGETFEAVSHASASLRATWFLHSMPPTVRCQLRQGGAIVLDTLTTAEPPKTRGRDDHVHTRSAGYAYHASRAEQVFTAAA